MAVCERFVTPAGMRRSRSRRGRIGFGKNRERFHRIDAFLIRDLSRLVKDSYELQMLAIHSLTAKSR
ncbi:MAG: hypothetical protein KatS3mg051_2020 [Anaerolineae bacterium]|nr:MAG: hypothetical protein KatS3mg051_2020 [Anaerolineae bacterium]